MGWRDVLSSPDPSRALYEAMRANPTASGIADRLQGGFETGMDALGALGHAMTVPARAVAGAAYNAAGTGAPVDVSDYALYGQDLETGRRATTYGELLAGTLEDSGEIQPGGMAAKLIRLAGDAVTDPMAAPGFLSGAEAAGSLAGAVSPAPMAPQPSRPRFPQASGQRGGMGGPRRAQPPPQAGPPGPGPNETPPSIPPGPSPTDTQPVPRFSPSGFSGWRGPGSPNPTATQPVPVRPPGPMGGGGAAARGGGAAAFDPTATQPVPASPTDTQRVPMARRGKGPLRPKAKSKKKSGEKE